MNVRAYELISTGEQPKIIRPNSSEKIMMKLSLDVDDKVKQGDYFIISIDEHIKPEWLKPYFTPPDIVTGDGKVVARARYDKNSKRIKYVFTDYVNDKVNINIKLNLAMGANKEQLSTESRYWFKNAVDGNMLENKSLDIKYLKPTSYSNNSFINANSAITKIDDKSKKVEYTILLNPKGLFSSRRDRGLIPLYIYRGNDRGVNIGRGTVVKVYTVPKRQMYEYMGNEIPEKNLSLLREFRNDSSYSNIGYEGNDRFREDYWRINFVTQNFLSGQGYIVKVITDYTGSPNDINMGFTWKFGDNYASQTQGIGDDQSSASYSGSGQVAPKRKVTSDKTGRINKKPGRDNKDKQEIGTDEINLEDGGQGEEPMEHIITVVNRRDVPVVLPNTGGAGSAQYLTSGISVIASSLFFTKNKKYIVKKFISLISG